MNLFWARHRDKLTVFDKEIDIDLLQRYPHARGLVIRKHDKLDIGRRLIEMQFVLRRAVGDETEPDIERKSDPPSRQNNVGTRVPVIFAAQLAHHIPQ
jgi:hypothetical protein